MNVIHSCAVCLERLEPDEQVIGVRRQVEIQNTGTLDPAYRSEDRYVHPKHEPIAKAQGYIPIGTGTLLEQETRRNPALFGQ